MGINHIAWWQKGKATFHAGFEKLVKVNFFFFSSLGLNVSFTFFSSSPHTPSIYHLLFCILIYDQQNKLTSPVHW
jgi:hypothetical protein